MQTLVYLTGEDARPYIGAYRQFGAPALLHNMIRDFKKEEGDAVDPSEGPPWNPSDDIYTDGQYTVAVNVAESSVSLVEAPPGETLAYLVEWQKKSGRPAQVWAA